MPKRMGRTSNLTVKVRRCENESLFLHSHRMLNSSELRNYLVVDPLDPLDEDLDELAGTLPPPPPGIDLPPPVTEMPPPPPSLPELDIPPPSPPTPQFGFTPDPGSDSDLLDAANSLSSSPIESAPESPRDFKSVWERRKSTDPTVASSDRDSIYNRIDRISSGKSGSLMERYSDRFGSDLDREIIVMRKKDQTDLASIKPTVELISAPTKATEMSFDELIDAMGDSGFVDMVSEKTGVSSEKLSELDMDSLRSFFDLADQDGSGALDFDEFVAGVIQSFRSRDEDFSHFFGVINNLLGELPEDKTNEFISSEGFEIFKRVGEDPAGVEHDSRSEFFKMVNELLVDLPEPVMQSFINSPDFELYKQIAERYGDS